MLEHSRLLGFSARRQAFQRVVAVPIPVQTVAESMVPVKTKSQAAVKTPVKAPIKVAAASVAVKPSGVAEKATRQDVQALVQFLQQMKPSNRPAHREVLLAVIKAQLRPECLLTACSPCVVTIASPAVGGIEGQCGELCVKCQSGAGVD